MPKLRIVIAGAGMIGRAHLAVVRDSPSCTACAIVDPSPAASDLARAAGLALYGSLDEIIARDKPDGVILATPNALHVDQALECIRAGIPVLVEKPIATTLAEGERLVRAVDAYRAKVLIGHHRAHSPIIAVARRIIEQGLLGRLVAVTGSATFLKPDRYFDEAPWRRAPGGGPILINMIHEVHNLRMLCGEIAAVQAFSSNAIRGYPVEDTAAISLRFANGALGTFMLSDTAASPRSWEQTSQENKAYASYDDEDCYAIAGTYGSLGVPTMRLKTYPRDEDRSWWKPFEVGVAAMVRDDPLKRQLEHFGDVIRGVAEPLVSARDGLANLRVTEAIAAAAKSGATVEIQAG